MTASASSATSRVAHIAAERREVADLDRAHERTTFRQRGQRGSERRVALQCARGDGGPDAEAALSVALEHAQVGHAGQIDDDRDLEHADFELGDEIGAAGKNLHLGAATLQGAQTIIDADRSDEIESTHANFSDR